MLVVKLTALWFVNHDNALRCLANNEQAFKTKSRENVKEAKKEREREREKDRVKEFRKKRGMEERDRVKIWIEDREYRREKETRYKISKL